MRLVISGCSGLLVYSSIASLYIWREKAVYEQVRGHNWLDILVIVDAWGRITAEKSISTSTRLITAFDGCWIHCSVLILRGYWVETERLLSGNWEAIEWKLRGYWVETERLLSGNWEAIEWKLRGYWVETERLLKWKLRGYWVETERPLCAN